VEDSGAVGGAAQGRLGRRERATWDRYGGRQARLGQYFARLLAFNPLNYGGLAVAATLEALFRFVLRSRGRSANTRVSANGRAASVE